MNVINSKVPFLQEKKNVYFGNVPFHFKTLKQIHSVVTRERHPAKQMPGNSSPFFFSFSFLLLVSETHSVNPLLSLLLCYFVPVEPWSPLLDELSR